MAIAYWAENKVVRRSLGHSKGRVSRRRRDPSRRRPVLWLANYITCSWPSDSHKMKHGWSGKSDTNHPVAALQVFDEMNGIWYCHRLSQQSTTPFFIHHSVLSWISCVFGIILQFSMIVRFLLSSSQRNHVFFWSERPGSSCGRGRVIRALK